ncbi:hypothetical protein RFI36_11850 [Acinetobacter gerneri]|uniref:Transcriptional regulator n=1 Tax=Acinetobacter gerneri TaxID=202952 RepID=A0AAW8JJ12_9GAMM|nr:hypothetical protein [Acinetobacter gerneri]MDQ9010305.1 hypothetical protein [Acinetobacter gerneri]MDQ9014504.1 hypothetical protein [Acinetobacter gerneri]MDQ9025675.1 hypothetical protein [Acinetobacter gerneri]MDQ9052956.1 hypothetical protein [Acinetobacter gerneri]MDQ9060606.1 hypothetical protein [Acinetobacter gerneri]
MPKETESLYKIEENILQEETIKIEKLFSLLLELPSDFYSEEREDEPPQEREDL